MTSHLVASHTLPTAGFKPKTDVTPNGFNAKLVINRAVYTVAALCNVHGQYDQIFAKVGDGHLGQREPAGHLKKLTRIWENRILAHNDWK